MDGRELWAWVDAELVGEGGAGLVVRREGLGLAAGGVQGSHEQGPEVLAEGVLGDQALELGDHVVVSAEVNG
jgi:hypothetical protein